jgi:hypothetical protein
MAQFYFHDLSGLPIPSLSMNEIVWMHLVK